ncbi:IclR family transcriptional regulator [Neorhodopirellula pilleata]|uniref:Transcriptional regulator KdgR n=1 Tax=Neorhodopirellula pilleata TaxID=2714738 RepID=A0A5C6A6J4_9BACT|nr:IclR family transcriptional regulator [Neorhodopirellula pilleata]TWT94987.1 Transcriptional regulator KdgR [Neorhodopirellula pilleata]
MASLTIREREVPLNDDLPAPTVAKTMAVIEAIGRKAEGLTQAEVVKETGCSANLVLRVLTTLETLGYMSRQDESRRYVLTSRLMESYQPRAVDKSLTQCAHAAMQCLRDRSRETVQLMIRVGSKGLVLEQVSGLEPVQVMGRIGMQVPLYSCAPGKAILAALAESELNQWLATTELKPFTENTKATRSDLMDDLQRSRRRGYAEDWEEGITGIRCVAAPIVDAYHRPVAAITVMSPTMRLPRKRIPELGQWCLEAAAQIRKELLS